MLGSCSIHKCTLLCVANVHLYLHMYMGIQVYGACAGVDDCCTRELDQGWGKEARDGMRHLDNLQMARNPLPLPGDLKFLWMYVKKIIDTSHIHSHRVPYDVIRTTSRKKIHHATPCREQTFAWISRFKKILAAMRKTHHYFLTPLNGKEKEQINSSFCYRSGHRQVKPNLKYL